MIKLELIKEMTTYQGKEYHNLEGFARDYVSRGMTDSPWEAYRGSMKCLHGDSIYKLIPVKKVKA